MLARCRLRSISLTVPAISNELVHDIAGDIGQAEVAAVVAEGEPFVIQAQQVKDRGVKIVMRDAVLDGVHAELVGGAVRDPRLTPPPAIHMEKP